MSVREYRGRLAAWLMGVAVMSAIGYLLARLATEPKLPLWPFALCAVLLVGGFILFVKWRPAQESQPTPGVTFIDNSGTMSGNEITQTYVGGDSQVAGHVGIIKIDPGCGIYDSTVNLTVHHRPETTGTQDR